MIKSDLLVNTTYNHFAVREGWLSSFVVLAFLMVAGMNFGTRPEAEFEEVDVALENAIAGSNSYGGVCCAWINTECRHPIGQTFKESWWYGGYDTCL